MPSSSQLCKKNVIFLFVVFSMPIEYIEKNPPSCEMVMMHA